MRPHTPTTRPDTALGLELRWLGQAGFVIQIENARLLIDPYLSDSLAEKYAGTVYNHQRMMPPPIMPDRLTGIDLILCTHGHTDHMDPATLGPLARANPNAQFILPQYERERALQIGLPEERTTYANPGESHRPLPQHDLQIIATPAAHENFEQDDDGNQRFMGYLIKSTRATLYHSGDTLAVDELLGPLHAHPPDLALLPCNGRDDTRRSRGVPGNMSLDEAINLCQAAGIPRLIPHHFGMFAFNTCPAHALHRASQHKSHPQIIVPTLNTPQQF